MNRRVARRRWQSKVDAGRAVRGICREPILRGQHWSLISESGLAVALEVWFP
jgi:hypothetical protein